MIQHYVKNPQTLLSDAAVTYKTDDLLSSNGTVPFLIGNGNFGGSLDRFGMANSFYGTERCYLWHKKHVEIGREHLECRLPLLLLRYRFRKDSRELPLSPECLTDYTQTLDVANGRIVTAFTLLDRGAPLLTLTLIQYASLAAPALMQSEFHVQPHTAGLTLEVECEMPDEVVSQADVLIRHSVTSSLCHSHPMLRSSTTRGSASLLLCAPDQTAQLSGHTLSLSFDCEKESCHVAQLLLVSSRDATTPLAALYALKHASFDAHRRAHEKAWADFWAKSAADTGDRTLNGIRIRSLYALRSSEGTEESDVPLSPSGLASTRLWPFEFPQDYLWMYESYFASNHLEMAKPTSLYWNSILDQVLAFTERYLGVRGAFFPWVPSMFDLSEMERPKEDPPFSWQLHNAAYPLRMVWLYWQYTHDDDYLRRILPVARAVADFYAAISHYDEHLHRYAITYKPCMGQDEFGGFCRDNYLCCMLSASWSIRTAREMFEAAGETPDPLWGQIDACGYVFDLLKRDGMLATYEGGPVPNPAQKHPSQLNALAALPLPTLYESPEFRETYRRRYKISLRSDENYWTGWSLGCFLIASVRMRDPAELRRDLAMLLANPNAEKPQFDQRLVQMYETGGQDADSSYFHTAMGMLVTATSELFLQTFDGVCTVFPVVPCERRMAFDSFLTPFSTLVSGEYENGRAQITLHVMRDAQFTLRLGENCRGTYRLANENGDVIAASDAGSFRLSLTPGVYTIA